MVTPSYGYGRFIEDAILSVRDRNLLIEHLVQDGMSSDETIDILKRFEGRIDWTSEPDEGPADALNKAIARATGRRLAWLNADEFYLPGGLAILVDEGDRTVATLLLRTSLDDQPLDPHGRRLHDWDLFMRLDDAGARFHHVAYPVGAFRVHGEQMAGGSWHAYSNEYAAVNPRHGFAQDPRDDSSAFRVGRRFPGS